MDVSEFFLTLKNYEDSEHRRCRDGRNGLFSMRSPVDLVLEKRLRRPNRRFRRLAGCVLDPYAREGRHGEREHTPRGAHPYGLAGSAASPVLCLHPPSASAARDSQLDSVSGRERPGAIRSDKISPRLISKKNSTRKWIYFSIRTFADRLCSIGNTIKNERKKRKDERKKKNY